MINNYFQLRPSLFNERGYLINNNHKEKFNCSSKTAKKINFK